MRRLHFDGTRLGPGWLAVSALAVACTGSLSPPTREAAGTPVPDGTAPAPPGMDLPVSTPGCKPPLARLWKLTPQQIERTLASLLPAASVDVSKLREAAPRGAAFSNWADWRDLSEPNVNVLLEFTRAMAEQAAAAGSALSACAARAPVTAECARTIIAEFGARAFRRPLSDAEAGTLATFFDAQHAAHGPEVALRQLLNAIFLSPSFLYRSELGDAAATAGPVALTQYERASALSYFITDSPPDAELLAAASAGALTTREQIRGHAQRLLASPDTARGIRQLFDEALKVETVLSKSKDPELFPDWSPELAHDMVEETRAFTQHVLWSGQARLSEMLTARYSFINERLAKIYGISGVVGNELRRVDLPPERAGLLMQGSFLAAEAKAVEGDIVHRGLRVVRDWFCREIPAPPPNAGALPPPTSEPLTLRERVSRHKTDPKCAGCHQLIDGPGFAFEAFDGIGRYRTVDAGKPIDTAGTFPALTGTVSFANAHGLTAQMIDNPDVQQCVVRRVFTYAVGREPAEDDACVIDGLEQSLVSTGGDLRGLLAELAANDLLGTRSK